MQAERVVPVKQTTATATTKLNNNQKVCTTDLLVPGNLSVQTTLSFPRQASSSWVIFPQPLGQAFQNLSNFSVKLQLRQGIKKYTFFITCVLNFKHDISLGNGPRTVPCIISLQLWKSFIPTHGFHIYIPNFL